MTMSKIKYNHTVQEFSVQNVGIFQERLDAFAEKAGVDCIVISSQDAFLSEYNVPQNNQRQALSGFTGSTGDGIFLSKTFRKKAGLSAPFVLFVDGRYHLQADLETKPEFVKVEKLSLSDTIEGALLRWLESSSLKACGFDAQRTTWKRFVSLSELGTRCGFQLKSFANNEVSTALQLPGWQISRAVTSLNKEFTGRDIVSNLQGIANLMPAGVSAAQSCLLTCASDDIAWLLNARGYHMPHASSFLGYSFVIGSEIVLYLPSGVENSPVEIEKQASTPHGSYSLTVIRNNSDELERTLREAGAVSHILFQEEVMNAYLPEVAKKIWPQAQLNTKFSAIEKLRAQKTEQEKQSMRDSFLRSSRAIAETMRWVKSEAKLCEEKGKSESTAHEISLRDRIADEYVKQGAIELSFRSIAGAGENGAIIHYGTPSDKRFFKLGDLVLLDSGAYYEQGFATDCTRVVFFGHGKTKPEQWQKEIYTTVLRSCVTGMIAEFDKTLPCKQLDAQIRGVCQAKGYDYGHGTGHGIGIHVHESGIRLSPASTYGFTENAAVSIEPGIYLAGRGGVRIENVAIVSQSPKNKDKFVFENLVFVGLDWDLIDVAQLSEAEKSYLKAYEARCKELGTHVTECPL